jgi:hypothetical protein
MQKSYSLLIEWCSSDRIVFLESLKIMIEMLNANSISLKLNLTKVQSNENEENKKSLKFEISNFDVFSEQVSLHAHFTRFFGAVLSQTSKFDLKTNQEVQSYFDTYSLKLAFIEPSIRAFVLYCQVNGGLWKKNGVSLLNQVNNKQYLLF